MKLPPTFADALALQPLDLATEGHDLRLECSQDQFMPRSRESQQARQTFGFGQGISGLGQPSFLI